MRLGECFKSALHSFKSYAGVLVLTSLILSVTELMLSLLLVLALKEVGVVLSYALTGVFWACYLAMARGAVREQMPRIATAISPIVRQPLSYLLVGLAIYSGLMGFGIGVFVTATLFMFAPLGVLDGSNPWQALSRSKDVVLAHPGEAILLCLFLTALNFVGMLALFVGWLVTMPLSALLIVQAYELASSEPLNRQLRGCHA
ncbi:MAG TPA: hypothetical protein VKP30_02880 [Polyangiaceae bacterium]|nr:hypothetical protein [Polyangiaceae bacterium]